MGKGLVQQMPTEYIAPVIKVANNRYIQDIIITKEPDMSWIAVNNVSIRCEK